LSVVAQELHGLSCPYPTGCESQPPRVHDFKTWLQSLQQGKGSHASAQNLHLISAHARAVKWCVVHGPKG
jgi:hypothetical protein